MLPVPLYALRFLIKYHLLSCAFPIKIIKSFLTIHAIHLTMFLINFIKVYVHSKHSFPNYDCFKTKFWHKTSRKTIISHFAHKPKINSYFIIVYEKKKMDLQY